MKLASFFLLVTICSLALGGFVLMHHHQHNATHRDCPASMVQNLPCPKINTLQFFSFHIESLRVFSSGIFFLFIFPSFLVFLFILASSRLNLFSDSVKSTLSSLDRLIFLESKEKITRWLELHENRDSSPLSLCPCFDR